jgi:hypothetical protein
MKAATVMRSSFEDYQCAILDAWCRLPCTRAPPPRSDRVVLLDLHRRSIPL